METITIDGMDEDAFRHSVEDMLRHDQIDQAVERLRGLLEPYAGGILPSRFLDVSSDDVEFGGWQKLADRLHNHDRPSHAISAIAVTLADARSLGGPGPRGGRMAPFIKTFYFSDEAYPFSIATRADLLDGYTRDGFEWEADYQATDATLSIHGLDDVYGAIVELEDRLLASPAPGEDEIRAGTIGACYLAALIHQSLRRTIREKGLPRAMCVLAACDGVYPFFDAPVAGSDETAPRTAAADAGELRDDDEANDLAAAPVAEIPGEEAHGEASLLDLVSHKGKKMPVLVLAEDDAREATRITAMAGAEQLGANEHILEELMQALVPAEVAGDMALGEDPDWGAFDGPDHASASGDVPHGPAGFAWEAGGDVLLPPDALDRPADVPEPAVPVEKSDASEGPESGFPAIGPSIGPSIGHAVGPPLEAPPELDENPAEAGLAAPTRHSLRARTRMAEVDESRSPIERFLAFVDGLGRRFLRLSRRKS